MNSVLKLISYGTRFRIIQSYPGNNGSYDPYSVLSWTYWILRSIISPILEIVDRTIHISILSWKSWIVRSMFASRLKTFVLLWNHPAGAFFCPKTEFSKMLDTVIFEKMSFRQKLGFWITYLERYLIKVVRMDRTDHFDVRYK